MKIESILQSEPFCWLLVGWCFLATFAWPWFPIFGTLWSIVSGGFVTVLLLYALLRPSRHEDIAPSSQHDADIFFHEPQTETEKGETARDGFLVL